MIPVGLPDVGTPSELKHKRTWQTVSMVQTQPFPQGNAHHKTEGVGMAGTHLFQQNKYLLYEHVQIARTD